MGKKGQVTIFIIIGIVIVSAVVLFFVIQGGVKIPGIGTGEKNPNSFLESCLEDSIKEATRTLSLHGGYIEPELYKNFKFENEDPMKIGYLCYTPEDYIQCVNQEPMLIKHLKEEIYDYIYDDVKNCFNSLTSSLDSQGYAVDTNYRNFEIDLNDNDIIVNIDAEVTLTKSGETTTQENFEVAVQSKFYELVSVAQEIVNKETINCEFNVADIGSYPEFDINKHKTADSSIIYTIKHEDSDEEFRFAVRGCVMPPGFGIELE